jgi:Ca2+-binding RTX toxin-like protein
MLINTNAATATLAGGTLTVEGTINDDNILVAKEGGNYDVFVNDSLICSFKNNTVSQIVVNGEFGDDLIDLSKNVTIYAIIFGGQGNDVIYGSNGSNELHGGDGDDAHWRHRARTCSRRCGERHLFATRRLAVWWTR